MTRARDIANYGKQTTDLGTQAELDAVAFQSVPYIIPDVLYPAVANIMVDGSTALSAVTTGPNSSTVASSKYGTVQSDGRMYYYTDIKGSKPIKDPRIGAHFGSQRHQFSSLQLLEQETATNGTNVYSVDGREWLRASGSAGVYYNSDGTQLYIYHNDAYIEVVGYFNNANILHKTSANRSFKISIDAGAVGSLMSETTTGSPLTGRFVNAGSVFNMGISETLGIHTIKIFRNPADDLRMYGIELIAQDTTSTATKSQIQIPSQNVVSYGKKFTVSETKHYNPFAFKTDGTTAWDSGAHNGTSWPIGTGSSTNIDTATSLGLDAWVSTNYYYPYNGGRVVKWVASDGTIKTSVNMMPPNARSIANSASLTNGTEKGDDSAGTTSAAVANNTFYPTFTDQTVDHSQAEVTRTFHPMEFGNGAANAGASSGWADASMMTTGGDDIAYVMDDGLTSLSGNAMASYTTGVVGGRSLATHTNTKMYLTFIGTGLSISMYQAGDHAGSDDYKWSLDGIELKQWTSGSNAGGHHIIAQNLPYGTHIFKLDRVVASNQVQQFGECSVYQPKMPPIPEDAVVLADYMLMADYVKQTAKSNGSEISKGVRALSGSRDVFYDSSSAFDTNAVFDVDGTPFRISGVRAGGDTTAKLHFFGTDVVAGMTNQSIAHTITFPGTTANAKTGIQAAADTGDLFTLADSATLGNNEVISTVVGGGYHFVQYHLATPIHTSSHYQPFETPYLHELVGGDRNMEQTNLVVTPDGKTWDEVTRDVSYIGKVILNAFHNTEYLSASNTQIFDEWRGTHTGFWTLGNKDFAIAYDRQICLVGGQYRIHYSTLGHWTVETKLVINGTSVTRWVDNQGQQPCELSWVGTLKRGDYVQIIGANHDSSTTSDYMQYYITRL